MYACFYKYASLLSILKNKIPKYCKKQIKNVQWLEAVLGEKITIKQVTHDARLEQLAREQKYGVLDLGVELEKGEFINVEIQLRNFKNIEKRTTFYASKKLTEQLNSGEDYIMLRPVIIIAILDYDYIDLPEYVTETVRVATGHRDYELNNMVKYYYIELSKFRKQNPDMTNPLNQWLSFLDMERGDLLEMAKKKNEKVKKAVENYEVLTGDAEVKRLAEIKLMADLEEKAALASARENGTKRGQELGLKQGKREIARKLLEMKMPIEEIIKITGLSENDIKWVKKFFRYIKKTLQKN